MADPLVARFLAHLAYRGRSPATIRRRRITLGQLARHLPLDEATTDGLEQFLGVWTSAATRRAYRADLRDFYRWAASRGHIAHDPAAGLAAISEPVTEPRPLPATVLAELLATPEPVTRRMIWVAAYAGLRVSEIAALEASDIDPVAATLRVAVGKGGHGRTVRLVPELAAELEQVGSGRLFPGASGASVSARIKRRMVQTGVPGAHPHQLRHSFATRAARALNGDVVAVAALLGHRSFATTRRYVTLWQPDAEQLRGLYGDAA